MTFKILSFIEVKYQKSGILYYQNALIKLFKFIYQQNPIR